VDRKKATFPRGGLAAVLLLLWIAGSITAARGEANQPEHDSAARVAELLKELELPESSANLQRRRDAARQLSEINPLPTEAIVPLTKALDTWDRGGVQSYARAALADAGARAIPALAAECNQSGRYGEGCQAAIGVLGQIARTEPAAWPVLIADFKSGFGGGAAIATAKIGAPVVPLLRRALKSDNPKTRAMAAKALSDIGPPAKDAIPDLLPLLNDTAGNDTAGPAQASGEWPSPVVQYEAALALANIDPTRKEALPVLRQLVTNHWTTGGEAIEAIGKMGNNGREAIPALERVLAGCCNRSVAVEALVTIEGCSAGPVVARVLEHDKDSNVRFHAARALADLGPDCPGTIPALVEALGDNQVDTASELARLGKPGLAALTPALQSPDLDVRKEVVEVLSNLALKAPWVGKPDEQTRPLPEELVQPLMVAMTDKSITLREQAARALQFAGGEPARLAGAELYRERETYAQEPALDRTPRTTERIAASIAPDVDHKYPLKIEYLFPIYQSVAVQEPEYLISLHRGRERSDRLVFWKKVGEGKYAQVKVMESPELDLSEGRFLPPKVFRAKVLVLGEGPSFNEFRQFVDVPQNGCNTWCVFDNVFAIGDGDFIPVQIESPEEWYKSRLRPGESTWHSNGNSFSDDKLSFGFSIWAGEDPHALPSAGEVTGTYKIVREDTGQPAVGSLPAAFGSAPAAANSGGAHPLTTWKMVVDTAERKSVVSR
jgi:HEAT repeat protein